MSAVRKVVVIGAGITGLACAHALRQSAGELADPLDVAVLEGADRFGGKICTGLRDGFVLESGPDGFHRDSPTLLRLVTDLGLAGELVASRAAHAEIYAHVRHPIPRGIIMGVPTDAHALRHSGLLSDAAKAQALGKHAPVPGSVPEDLSLDQFFRERFGSGYTEGIVAPLLAGIHGHPLHALSTRAILPRLLALADTGADLRGVLARPHPSKRSGAFRSLRRGLASLPAALAAALPPGAVRRSWPVVRIDRCGLRYVVYCADGRSMQADAVVLAVPASAAARLLHAEPAFAALLTRPPASLASVHLMFRGNRLPATRGCSGFLAAAGSPCRLTGATFGHRKWHHVAPAGDALVRCVLPDPDPTATDDALSDAARDGLGKVLGPIGVPDLARVVRWRHALPAYLPGHRAAVARVRDALARSFPGVQLSGAAYDGVSLESCVRQGQQAAHATLRQLAALPSPRHEEPTPC